MRNEKSAGFIVYLNDNGIKFLLLKYKTYWGFPKGLLEKDEDEEQAAVRELEEETGLKNPEIIPGFKFEQEWFYKLNNETIHKKADFFLARVSSEEARNVKISFEHEGFDWLSYEDSMGKLKIKNNREMLKKAYLFMSEMKTTS